MIQTKNRLKELRARHNLSQQDLAQKVQVTRQTILAIEKERYNPSLELAFKLSKVFNCQIEDIFIFGEEKETPIQIAYCASCGYKLSPNASFCEGCGSKIRK